MSTQTQSTTKLSFLTESQLAFFKDNGYLVIPKFFSKEWIDKLKKQLKVLIDSYDPTEHQSIFKTDEKHVRDEYFMTSADKIRFFLEDGVFDPKTKKLLYDKMDCINKVAHALHDKDPVYKEFSYQPNIKKILKDIGYREPKIVQSMVILKPAKHGGVVSPHQDSTFVYSEKTPCVGFWFALDDATIENACLWGIPGSHKKGLACRWERDDNGKMKFVQLNKDLDYVHGKDEDKYVPLECPAGHFVHKSFGNTSNKARYAYTLHCVEGDEKWSEKCWIQRKDNFPQYWTE